MFKRLSKKSVADDAGTNCQTFPDDVRASNFGAVRNSDDLNRGDSMTQQVSITSAAAHPSAGTMAVDENFDDQDLPIDLRMRRNLHVSRSGRYKSKSRPRPSLNQPSDPGLSGSTTRPAGAGQINVGTKGYVPVAAAAPGTAVTSSYRGLTTAL